MLRSPSRSLLLALAMLLPAPAAAQGDGEPCDCARELSWATARLARNYSGFADKVTPATRPAYDSLLARLAVEARGATTAAQCNQVLSQWVLWFRDRHISLARPGTGGPATAAPLDTGAVRARFAGWETLALGDEAAARARLGGAALDPIEGIWESSDGRYRAAVVRDPKADREFAMVVLRADSVWWMPGQVKATFERAAGSTYAARFFMLDHAERRWEARVAGPVLAFSEGSPWLRRWPVASAADTLSPARFRATLNTRFDAREVAPGTVLVSVPTFDDPHGMDSLWARHGTLIRGAERLVIDVRGNGGGSDYNFRELLPLLYTDPVKLPGNFVYATDDNLAANERLAADTTIPAGQREWIRNDVRRARERRGPDGWMRYEGDTYRTQVRANPREVAIIQDRGCASSCEGFVLRARQSRKVTTYGTNTSGIHDYGNVRESKAPCGTLVLRHPTTRAGYMPEGAIDNVGIPPQVAIPATEVFPVDWVLRRMAERQASR
jgi:hypothetical protein